MIWRLRLLPWSYIIDFFFARKTGRKNSFHYFFTMNVIYQPCQFIRLLDYNINQAKKKKVILVNNNTLFLAATSKPVFLPNLMAT